MNIGNSFQNAEQKSCTCFSEVKIDVVSFPCMNNHHKALGFVFFNLLEIRFEPNGYD